MPTQGDETDTRVAAVPYAVRYGYPIVNSSVPAAVTPSSHTGCAEANETPPSGAVAGVATPMAEKRMAAASVRHVGQGSPPGMGATGATVTFTQKDTAAGAVVTPALVKANRRAAPSRVTVTPETTSAPLPSHAVGGATRLRK